MTSRVECAVELFNGGCACSQAVFAAYAPDFGVDADTAVKIASGFGGGMKMAETCGALTGAFMVLGLAFAGDASRTGAGRQAAGDKVAECAKQFRERRGALTCRDILGCNIHTPEGRQSALDRNVFKTTCVDAVRDAASIVESLL